MPVLTRSAKKKLESKENIVFNIDFDDASKEWMKNKQKLSFGQYKYICCASTKRNTPCRNPPYLDFNYCKMHNKLYQESQKEKIKEKHVTFILPDQ